MNDRRPASRPEPAASPPAQTPAPTAAADKDEASKQRKGGGWDDDDDDPWRHAPVAPRDESPAKSLGRSVSEVVTGPLRDEGADKAGTKP
jgi:hypothetical protein